ncbi:MAG: serine hydrolase domain-containing protein, partial [Chloroflexota bacterium]
MQHEIVTPEVVGLSSERLKRIKPAMQAYVDRKQIAGLSTMIARKGKVVHFEQVGQMDIEANKPISNDTIFRIYSMTKPIVSTALMTLYEQGLFHLFHPVEKFIPAFGNLKVLENDAAGQTKEVDLARPITIRDLLTHTAGLTYDFLEDSPVCELYRQTRLGNNAERSLEEFVATLTHLPLAYQPGTRWHYSVSIDVVARLIEVISGQSLNEFLQETLFKPLGMVDTGFHVPDNKQNRLATMYGLPDLVGQNTSISQLINAWERGFNEQIDVSATYPATQSDNFARGGYGLFSTAWDYMRFAQMLLNQGELDGTRILGRKTIELMHMNHLPTDLLPFQVVGPPTYGYGFGLGSRVLMNVAESEKPGSVGEFGWAGAANETVGLEVGSLMKGASNTAARRSLF